MSAESVSLGVAIASLSFSVISVVIAIGAYLRGNKNAAASMLVSLNDGFCQAWRRFLAADNQAEAGQQCMKYELAELLNLLEIAAAVYVDKTMAGVSKKLLETYLVQCLTVLSGNGDARKMAQELATAPDTFEFIRKFVKARPDCSSLCLFGRGTEHHTC